MHVARIENFCLSINKPIASASELNAKRYKPSNRYENQSQFFCGGAIERVHAFVSVQLSSPLLSPKANAHLPSHEGQKIRSTYMVRSEPERL